MTPIPWSVLSQKWFASLRHKKQRLRFDAHTDCSAKHWCGRQGEKAFPNHRPFQQSLEYLLLANNFNTQRSTLRRPTKLSLSCINALSDQRRWRKDEPHKTNRIRHKLRISLCNHYIAMSSCNGKADAFLSAVRSGACPRLCQTTLQLNHKQTILLVELNDRNGIKERRLTASQTETNRCEDYAVAINVKFTKALISRRWFN